MITMDSHLVCHATGWLQLNEDDREQNAVRKPASITIADRSIVNCGSAAGTGFAPRRHGSGLHEDDGFARILVMGQVV
jgi:hypothetical protein